MEDKSENMRILEMIESGKISVEEGLGLLAALDAPSGAEGTPGPETASLVEAVPPVKSGPGTPALDEPLPPPSPDWSPPADLDGGRPNRAGRLRARNPDGRPTHRAAAGCPEMAPLVDHPVVDRGRADRVWRAVAVRGGAIHRRDQFLVFLCRSSLHTGRAGDYTGMAEPHFALAASRACSKRRARRRSVSPSACRYPSVWRPGSCASSGTGFHRWKDSSWTRSSWPWVRTPAQKIRSISRLTRAKMEKKWKSISVDASAVTSGLTGRL